MISLLQTLQEGREAPLYHGTSIGGGFNIVTDTIHPLTWHTSTVMFNKARDLWSGISLTRNKDFAMQWGPLVIQLNQIKLTQRYRLAPVNWMITNPEVKPDKKHEYEEFLIFDRPFNIRPYITRIDLSLTAMFMRQTSTRIQQFGEIVAEYKIPVYAGGVKVDILQKLQQYKEAMADQ